MENARSLWKKYQAGLCTEQERELLEHWFHHLDKDKPLELTEQDFLALKDEMWKEIDQAGPGEKPYKLWPRMAAAASILLLLGAGSYFILRPKANQGAQKSEALLPATQGIMLTVAGKNPINIAYHHTGQVTDQVSQTDSLLQYQSGTKTVEMQTLINNSGHQITVQLADGTETILDVASTLTYPSAFTGKERRITLNGQAYFKVKHDPLHPFFVDYHGQHTEDIGTEFNINAYDNEPATVATLISGSVQVSADKEHRILKPGEQAIADAQNLKVQAANLAVVTAWLQEKMIVHGETLESIMRNISRIYQVDVVWQDESVRKTTFFGLVSRSKKLASILNFMRETGKADFRVEGRTIYVFKPTIKPQ